MAMISVAGEPDVCPLGSSSDVGREPEKNGNFAIKMDFLSDNSIEFGLSHESKIAQIKNCHSEPVRLTGVGISRLEG